MHEDIQSELADMDAHSCRERDRSEGRRSALQRQSVAWSKIRRRTSRLMIVDDNDVACVGEAAAALLYEHWASTFAHKTTSISSMSRLEQFIVPALERSNWILSAEEFASVVQQTPNSAPGPDGSPHAAYRHCGESFFGCLCRLH